MKLLSLKIRAELAEIIESIWWFESGIGIPSSDSAIVVPHSSAKLIVPVCGKLKTEEFGLTNEYPLSKILVTGIWDHPVSIRSSEYQINTLIFRLTTIGGYQIFPFPLHESTNKILYFSDIFGKPVNNLEESISNIKDPYRISDSIQEFLIYMKNLLNRENPIVNYVVSQIQIQKGQYFIQEIFEDIGYSKRYIDKLFQSYVGVSPKLISSIERFQSIYKTWAKTDIIHFQKLGLLDLYYDQSHFIKEFKKYTGHSPNRFTSKENQFGKLFYKNL
ncbi:helix-turn-helix domain-containing protein [Leptospira bandrabouensis]|uniref:helix-turn-helix domain-containing protein n=1 Tax=Leptospira bandrabouensis TaxID=2484903 RepID=UPI001EE82E09|nr:helix-turn-helix domain-containing protein [Leptospira bandrabouensis]MCG6145827.1 helix-turn-helix domain-containing protein [Leptospira bandrabouensis]MCG6153148.1 helix-turn-helix domain-containing protein [Leptospira bandrabouensis]MCG6160630.1 helix-turn-helix domain-containing protein [Leptospira bandrabouensis]MCG6165171.1 helix-turn-helix domain-containing protein [Leptospira bandrabouensis]